MTEKTVEQAISGAIRLLLQLKEKGTFTGTPEDEIVTQQLEGLQEALDADEWTQKGLNEWRAAALVEKAEARRLDAKGQIAVLHLNKVLNGCQTAHEQQQADTAARLWLESIGVFANKEQG